VNRFLVPDAVAFPLQYIVKPSHIVAAFGQLSGIGRIFQLRYAAVTNRRDDQPAPTASALTALVVQRDERIDRALQKDIVPAAKKHAWGMDPLRLRFGIHFRPEIVVLRMIDEGF